MKTLARFTRLGGILVVLALSCTPDRPAPGSDLPPLPTEDASIDAAMQPGSSVNGRYVAITNAKTPDNVVKVTLNFIFDIQQTGKIEDGSATLSGTVYIDQYEAQTKKDFSAVPVSKTGGFQIDVQNMVIPKALNNLLDGDVTDTTVSFQNVQVISSCEFTGKMVGTLRNVQSKAGALPEVIVSGNFDAIGTASECASLLDGGTPETGGEAAVPDAAEEPLPEAAAEAGVDAATDEGADAVDETTDAPDDVADAEEGS
ncbi:MAG: hypothetical protein HY898_18650 [Deltaproteobacteria bacterium]|nr:hypothetical protein [Deltaproteobacteria bacterium]